MKKIMLAILLFGAVSASAVELKTLAPGQVVIGQDNNAYQCAQGAPKAQLVSHRCDCYEGRSRLAGTLSGSTLFDLQTLLKRLSAELEVLGKEGLILTDRIQVWKEEILAARRAGDDRVSADSWAWTTGALRKLHHDPFGDDLPLSLIIAPAAETSPEMSVVAGNTEAPQQAAPNEASVAEPRA